MALLLSPFNFDFTTIDLRLLVTAVALVVALITLIYFQWWRNRKRLSYELVSNIELVSAAEQIRDEVEIRYKGEPVKNVTLLLIKLINDGYQPIKKEDFEKPIEFIFTDSRVLTVEKVEAQPWNLNPEIGRNPRFVRIEPALFNRKDYLQFKVLLTDFHEMQIDARIVGVSAIKKTRNYYLPDILWMVIPILLVVIVNMAERPIIVFPALGILVAGSVLLIVRRSYRRDRRK
jgi:hypothetical protein